VRTPLLLYALALMVRLVLIVLFPDPAYPDSFYYVDVARAIHEGRGLNVDFVWIFAEVGGNIPADPTLPIPSNAHWMPLASFVQVPFLAILGTSALASALPFAILGALAAPLTWAIAREAGARPLVATGAGILTALPALSLAFMAQPDNFSLFQPLVAGALWMAGRGLKGHPGSFALAGLLAGLATLSRNDGVLVLGALGLTFLYDRWRAWRSAGGRRPAIPLAAAIACVVLFFVAVGPWYLRQLAVFGTLSPSTASGKVLFIRSIDEWNSISTPATLEHLLAQGLGPLLESRVQGLIAAFTIFATLVGGVVLVPFMLVGGWFRRRSGDFGPFFAYAGMLFAFSALVSAVHVPGGTFIHSAVALAPHSYVLALEGIAGAVGWVAARRRAWREPGAGRIFVTAAVAFTAMAAIVGSLAVHGQWDDRRDRMTSVDRSLDAAGATSSDRLMSIDAAGYRYWSGRGGVVLPNDPLQVIERAARAYHIRWLILERDDTVPAAAAILDHDERPSWLGPAVAVPGGGDPEARIYPVCLDELDDRCPRSSG
jgi:hypothetical protein